MYAALRRADVILHAGDVVTADLLTELETFAPVIAVLGTTTTSSSTGCRRRSRSSSVACPSP